MIFDDSIFGCPNDHQYYLDLYGELAKLPKKRYWAGEGALSVVGFDDGRELLKRASDSGLFRVVMGLESVQPEGLAQGGVRGKLGLARGETVSSRKIYDAIETIQDFGIEILGFFVIGFDGDTIDTFQRTLEFCKKTKIIPMITILSPTPDCPMYKQFESEGRFLPNLSWTQFIADDLIFTHPSMTGEEMYRARYETLGELYGLIPILERVMNSVKNHPGPAVFFASLFTQLGMRKGIRKSAKLLQ
jgi:radical SAM superfamily enzyme YgiQ (UPF0313 family)